MASNRRQLRANYLSVGLRGPNEQEKPAGSTCFSGVADAATAIKSPPRRPRFDSPGRAARQSWPPVGRAAHPAEIVSRRILVPTRTANRGRLRRKRRQIRSRRRIVGFVLVAKLTVSLWFCLAWLFSLLVVHLNHNHGNSSHIGRRISLQLAQQLGNRCSSPFRGIGKVHFGPPSHVRRQQGIQQGIQLRIGQGVWFGLVRRVRQGHPPG